MSLDEIYNKYPKEKVDEAIALLKYKNAKPLPRTESDIKPTIYIFRHGETTDNANFLFSGWRDPELTEKGRQQALSLAEKLKDKKIDMLIASTQKRAIDTMKLAMSLNDRCKNMEIHTDKRIMERSYGDLQGKSKLEALLENPAELEQERRSYNIAPPGGESIETVCNRVANFCDEIVPLMKKFNINIAISCHGNSIRGFRKYFENLTDEEIAHLETPLAQTYGAYVVE